MNDSTASAKRERLIPTAPRIPGSHRLELFVGATHASTGKLRVFREHEITVEVLLASACLPKIHHAVKIDGEAYWDGGYSANPAVFPLFYDWDARDVLLVLLGPLKREDTRRTVGDIDARIAELAFGANLMREMRTFAQASAFARSGLLSSLSSGRLDRRLRQMRFHMIDASDLSGLERTETKALAYGPCLDRLRAQGRERGSDWLSSHAQSVGGCSSIDVNERFG